MTVHSLLVLGGARSGKSRHAQQRAEATRLRPVFIATAQAFDAEMSDRIARHRAERGAGWETVEAPLELPAAIERHGASDAVLLVDCLTLWASNLMMAERDAEKATGELLAAISRNPGPLILVSNEVGLGIVPDTPLGRRFRDIAGTMNQHVARSVSEVQFLISGLPLSLKP